MFHPIPAIEAETNHECARLHVKAAVHPGGDWLALIDQFGGNIFHTAQWAESRRSATSRALFLRLCDGTGNCLGIAVGIEMWSPAPAIGRFSKQLALETYPVVRDDRGELVRSMLHHIIAHARKHGFRKVEVNSYLARTLLERPADLGVETDRRIEFVVDLTRSDSQLFAGFNTHHKRKIKKAQKHGLQFFESHEPQAMRQFRELQKRSRDRRLARGQSMAVMQDSYYENLGRHYFASDLGTVFMLLHEGRPVTAAFVAHYGTQALYMYGGSNDAGFELDAPILLFSHIFTRCRQRGYRLFNLGGVPEGARQPEDESYGLFRFKTGFGGSQRTCQNLIADHLNPSRDKLLNALKRILSSRR
jgi:Acetyltransferase (GNAT) domain